MFNQSIDKRSLYMLLFVFVLLGVAQGIDLQYTVLLLPGVIIAITFHEFAHAFVANKLGDDTPRLQNRLNLNPLSHIDVFGFVMLIFAGFGWGKPVQINPRNFTRKISMSKGEALVSIAGPLMNFFLAFVFLIIYYIAAFNIPDTQVNTIILKCIQYTASINISLGVFNLIPLPPLDGSKILKNFLPYKAKQFFVNNESKFYMLFLIIWITPIAGLIITPAIRFVFSGLNNLVFTLVQIFL